MQKYTSKNTSVNTTKLPAVYNKVCWDKLPQNILVLDWGCGRNVDLVSKELIKYGLVHIGYDPNWRSEEANTLAFACVDENDVFICSNVLNVIDDDEIIKDICKRASQHRYFFITVYEGDKSGVGKCSKEDCYQRNMKTKSYIQYFPTKDNVYVKKGVLTNAPNLIK